jgi:hypothetical protein
MVRKDYLLRVIEQFAAFLEKILFLKKAGDYTGAEAQVDATVRVLLGMEPEALDSMSVEDILKDPVGGKKFDVDICLVIAELYNQKADLAAKNLSGPTRFGYLEKSFRLYSEAIRHGASREIYRDRMLAIADALRHAETANALKLELMWFYELCGLYAKAEDTLFELVDSARPGMRNVGMEFYRRLMDKEDVLLAIGNLPREEVVEGYTRFSEMPE